MEKLYVIVHQVTLVKDVRMNHVKIHAYLAHVELVNVLINMEKLYANVHLVIVEYIARTKIHVILIHVKTVNVRIIMVNICVIVHQVILDKDVKMLPCMTLVNQILARMVNVRIIMVNIYVIARQVILVKDVRTLLVMILVFQVLVILGNVFRIIHITFVNAHPAILVKNVKTKISAHLILVTMVENVFHQDQIILALAQLVFQVKIVKYKTFVVSKIHVCAALVPMIIHTLWVSNVLVLQDMMVIDAKEH
jgi:hypothetical protein